MSPPGPGKGVTVIDTGLDVSHPEFAGRPNTTLLNAQSTTGAEDELHGTAVSSVVAAPENGVGLAGVYPQAALAEWDSGPTFVSDVIEGMEHALDAGQGVINMSFGFDGYDPLLADEVDIAFGTGTLLVAAAGNDFLEGNARHSPAALPHVLTVGATDEQNHASYFSNRSLAVDSPRRARRSRSRCRHGQALPATRRRTARASRRRSSRVQPRGCGRGGRSST